MKALSSNLVPPKLKKNERKRKEGRKERRKGGREKKYFF
jgi:hypothetical protein